MSTEIEKLITAIKEDRENTQRALTKMEQSIVKMSESFTLFYQHIATVESERKHTDQFKKETREFQEYARPILVKSNDWHIAKSKLLLIAGGIVITAIAVLLGVKP
tara:strand:- start:232 stop:549 length:318 start_codon:yes stop_codon:yes gene_type:complete